MNDAQPNPYQPPAAIPDAAADTDWTSQPDGRIEFDVALTAADVKRYFGKPFSLAPLVFSFVAVGILSWISSLPTVFLFLLFVLAAMFTFVRLRVNWKLAIRQTPRLLEAVHGYITPSGMYTASEGREGFGRWDEVHSLRTTDQCVIFSGESWRLVSLIVPWESFRNPAAARRAIADLQAQRKNWNPIKLGDPRQLNAPPDEAMFQPPESHVAFAGEVAFSEIASSDPGRKLRGQVFKMLAIAIVVFVAAALTAMLGVFAMLLLSLPLFVFSGILSYQIIRHPLIRMRPDLVAFRAEGWICPSGFFMHGYTGQTRRQWSAVGRQWHNDKLLSLRLPGSSEGWFFFSRNQFASDDDFSQACRWAEQGLQRAAAESR